MSGFLDTSCGINGRRDPAHLRLYVCRSPSRGAWIEIPNAPRRSGPDGPGRFFFTQSAVNTKLFTSKQATEKPKTTKKK